MKILLSYVIVFFVLVILDAVWLGVVTRNYFVDFLTEELSFSKMQ
jgi:hypothetical protein